MELCSTSNLLPWDHGEAALAVYRKFSTLHMSLFPYRYAAAQQSAKTGIPIVRALVLEYQDDPQARAARYEYIFGPDLLVAPIVDEGTQRAVYLPVGEWIDYWTGSQITGGRTIIADAPIDSLPLYAKQGAILPKIPDDVMTLVPAAESGNKALKTIDDRRVYELIGPAASSPASITDFEGRTVTRSGNTLTITGDAFAHIIIRWKFQTLESATVNGASVKLQNDANGTFVAFDHAKSSAVAWQ
jgi:alpha-D-xyloside xylohydrolase